MLSTENKNLYVLFVARMCSALSFSVIFSSISLFLTGVLKVDEKHTADLVGSFLALNYILPVLGGYIGSKIINFKSFYVIGMIVQGLGYLLFTFLGKTTALLALSLLLTGSMINSLGVIMFISQTVGESHNLRRLAMLWNYIAMNIGFFLGYMLSGFISQDVNYRVLFWVSCIFPFISALIVGKKLTYESAVKSAYIKFSAIMLALVVGCFFSLKYALLSREILIVGYMSAFCLIFYFGTRNASKEVKMKMGALSYYMLMSIFFWSIYMLTPTSLMNMIKDYVQTQLSHHQVAPQWLNNVDAIVLIVGGALFAKLVAYLKEKFNYQIPTHTLFFLGALCVAVAAFQFNHSIKFYLDAKMPLVFVVSYLGFLSLGELFLGPEGYALPAKFAPESMRGLLTGCWISTLGFASLISTLISDHMFNKRDNLSLSRYADVYHNIGLIFFIFAIASFFVGFWLEQSIRKARS